MAVRFLSQQSKSWIDNLSHSLVASVEKGFTRGHISMPAGEATAPGIYMDAVMASLMRVFGDPFKWGLEGFKRKVASQYDSVARQIAARIMLTAKSIVQTSGYHPAITNSSITGGWREITDWALRRRKVRRDPKYKTRPLYDTGSLAASIQLRRDNVRGPVLGGGGNLEGFRAADQFKEDSGASRSSGDYYVVVPAKQTSRGNRINIGMIHEFGSVVPAITPFGVSGVRYIPPRPFLRPAFEYNKPYMRQLNRQAAITFRDQLMAVLINEFRIESRRIWRTGQEPLSELAEGFIGPELARQVQEAMSNG